MRITCLGEALVDLICEQPANGLGDAPAFAPHFGGAIANVAVHAARRGGEVAICGGVGDDEWGRWLKAELGAAGVDTGDLVAEAGAQTPLAFVTLDHDGEPDYTVYGSTTGLGLVPAASRIPDAAARAELLLLSTNTMLGERERELTLLARERVLAAGGKLCVDANLRLPRWESRGGEQAAKAAAVELLNGAFLAKMNAAEAELITGEAEPARAAEALRGELAANVVVTAGAAGAVLRGENGLAREVPAIPVAVRSTVGAGDAVTGVLLAALAASGAYPPSLLVALPQAMEVAADVVGRWGAV